MAGPQEPSQSVAGAPRDDVQVNVGHALADHFVEGEERSFGPEGLPLRRGYPPPDVHQWAQEALRGFGQRGVMGSRDNQRVPVEYGTVVKEGHKSRLVDDEVGPHPAVYNAVKDASWREDEITLCLAYERYTPGACSARDHPA
jgi:hypothetical protein